MEDTDKPDQSFFEFLDRNFTGTLDEGKYFTLSPQAISTLDLLPKLKPDWTPDLSSQSLSSSRSFTTVYSVLNNCRTASGRRLLAVWLKNPLKCKSKIDIRLNIVHYLTQNTELRQICHDEYLKRIPDLLRLAFKVAKERCNVKDLVKVYLSVKSIRELCVTFVRVIDVSSQDVPDAIKKLFAWCKDSCDGLNEFMSLIEETIDVDSVDESGDYMVKPNSNEGISRVMVDINSMCVQARKLLQYVATDIGLEPEKTVKLETDNEKGFAFRVTKNNEPSVRGNTNYEQLSLVKKDGYRFTDRTLTKLSLKYVSAREEYNKLAKSIIDDLVGKATIYEDEITQFSMSVTVIDVFVSLAVAAYNYNYCKPLIMVPSARKIQFDQLRHPCVENQPDVENYVPNDLLLSDDDKRFFLISGPNMGGKSTFIKSVAVGVIMAQIGSLVPAEEAKVSTVDGVWTRIGAGDKQLEGVSTFMEEMMDISSILSSATSDSLVIIDELGRGTSTFDGFGLAWAISKNLATEIKCYTLFATHFHELTELEEEVDCVGNLYVKAICQDEKLTMLFNVNRGVSGESYGINVAQFTKFPDRVVESAKAKMKRLEEVPGFGDKKEVRQFVRECVRDHMAGQITR